jgi:putative membrane protein
VPSLATLRDASLLRANGAGDERAGDERSGANGKMSRFLSFLGRESCEATDSPRKKPNQGVKKMRIISFIIAIILIVFGLTFALLNAKPVELNYYIGTAEISLSLLLVLTVGLGIIIGFIFTLGSIIKLKQKNYHLKSRVKQLEQEIVSIRVPSDKGI